MNCDRQAPHSLNQIKGNPFDRLRANGVEDFKRAVAVGNSLQAHVTDSHLHKILYRPPRDNQSTRDNLQRDRVNLVCAHVNQQRGRANLQCLRVKLQRVRAYLSRPHASFTRAHVNLKRGRVNLQRLRVNLQRLRVNLKRLRATLTRAHVNLKCSHVNLKCVHVNLKCVRVNLQRVRVDLPRACAPGSWGHLGQWIHGGATEIVTSVTRCQRNGGVVDRGWQVGMWR